MAKITKITEEPTLVYTLIVGRKNYIASTMPHHLPNKILVNYSPDANNAVVYSSRKAAKETIKKIHNIHDREFFTEPKN